MKRKKPRKLGPPAQPAEQQQTTIKADAINGLVVIQFDRPQTVIQMNAQQAKSFADHIANFAGQAWQQQLQMENAQLKAQLAKKGEEKQKEGAEK